MLLTYLYFRKVYPGHSYMGKKKIKHPYTQDIFTTFKFYNLFNSLGKYN